MARPGEENHRPIDEGAMRIDHLCSGPFFLFFPNRTDHIAAVDIATRNLISLGRLPIMTGLFFSLGHSTIVIVVNVAISISVAVYTHLGGVSEVGGIVGASVSASFLALIGLFNSVVSIEFTLGCRGLGESFVTGSLWMLIECGRRFRSIPTLTSRYFHFSFSLSCLSIRSLGFMEDPKAASTPETTKREHPVFP